MSSSTKQDGKAEEPKKFMFDQHDFDALEKARHAPDEVTFTEAELDVQKKQAYEEGFKAGQQQSLHSIEQDILIHLGRIGETLNQLLQAEQQRIREKDESIVHLTLRVAQKLLPKLTQKYALTEVEQTISSTIVDRLDEPRIAVKINPALLDPLKSKIDQVASDIGFTGNVILISDDHLGPSDCRVEWADGGAERSFDLLYQTIQSEFTQVLNGLHSQDKQEAITLATPTNQPIKTFEPKIDENTQSTIENTEN